MTISVKEHSVKYLSFDDVVKNVQQYGKKCAYVGHGFG
jgi:hypothetical protein